MRLKSRINSWENVDSESPCQFLEPCLLVSTDGHELNGISQLTRIDVGQKEWQPWVVDDQDEVDKLLKGAYDRGLNTWDTANGYSNGASEVMIGEPLRKPHGPKPPPLT